MSLLNNFDDILQQFKKNNNEYFFDLPNDVYAVKKLIFLQNYGLLNNTFSWFDDCDNIAENVDQYDGDNENFLGIIGPRK